MPSRETDPKNSIRYKPKEEFILWCISITGLLGRILVVCYYDKKDSPRIFVFLEPLNTDHEEYKRLVVAKSQKLEDLKGKNKMIIDYDETFEDLGM